MPGDWPSPLGSLRYGGNVCLRRFCLPPAAGCCGLTLPLGLGLRLMSQKKRRSISNCQLAPLWQPSSHLYQRWQKFQQLSSQVISAVGLRGMVEMSAGTSGNRMIRNKARIVPPRLQSKVMAKRSFGVRLPSLLAALVLP